MKTNYLRWLKKAQEKGWKTPTNNATQEASWLAYWQACEAYERNPNAGRPVVPHRPGSQMTGEERDTYWKRLERSGER